MGCLSVKITDASSHLSATFIEIGNRIGASFTDASSRLSATISERKNYITASFTDASSRLSATISERENHITASFTDASSRLSASFGIVCSSSDVLQVEVFMASDGDFILADGGTFNVLKGAPQPELPYDILEYLTFDGTKVFDTGYYGNNLTTIETKFQRVSSSPAMYLFGTTSGSRLTAYLNRSGYWRYGKAYPTFSCNNTTLWEAVVTPTGTTVGDTTKGFSVEAFTTDFTIPVGGYKGSSGVATPHYVGKLYYFRMSIDDVVVVDWVPVRRKSDGAELFWDNVTEQFIENI